MMPNPENLTTQRKAHEMQTQTFAQTLTHSITGRPKIQSPEIKLKKTTVGSTKSHVGINVETYIHNKADRPTSNGRAMSIQPTAVALPNRDSPNTPETPDPGTARGASGAGARVATTILNTMKLKLLTALTACTFVLLVGATTLAAPPAQARAIIHKVDIPAQALGEALKALSAAADEQLLFSDEVVNGKHSTPVKGDYSTDDALAILLQGSGLKADRTRSGVLLIRSPAPTSSNVAVGGADVQRFAGNSSSARANAANPSFSPSDKKGFWSRILLAQTESKQSGSSQSDSPSSSSSKESPDSSGRKALEEIVVTAQKRVERLQNVPISASVLSGAELDRDGGIAEIKEALSGVPGVSVQQAGSGIGGQVVIRGVAAAATLTNGSSATAYYLDSVPFGFVKSALAPDLGPYDLDRVEVLRGPQGTLYGASALNGVVRVLTKDPSLDGFDFKARLGASHISKYSSGMNYRADAAVNIPIIEDKLAARATVSYQDWSGWIDRLDRLGFPPSSKKDANDAQLSTMRLKIKAQPTDELSIDASVWLDRADYGGLFMGTKSHTRISALPEPSSRDYNAYNFKVGYDFPAFTVTSATNHVDYVAGIALDLLPSLVTEAASTNEVFAQEVNVVSTHEGPWRWSVGGLYRDAVEFFFQKEWPNSNINLPVPASDRDFASESFAVFGELTYAFLEDRLELTGGLRYFEDTQTHNVRSVDSNGAVSLAAAGRTLPFKEEADFKKWTPRFILNWRPDDQLMLYASYGQGYRSGAHQNLGVTNIAAVHGLTFPAADPDTLTNYEIGAKGGLFDGLVAFDAALYYIDWKGAQQNIRVFLRDAQGNILASVNGLVNSKSISGIGVDAGLIVKPAEGLELGGNLSWNGLAADADVISGTTLLFAKGDRPAFSPEWTLSGSASYAFPLGGAGFMGRLSGSVNYTSAYNARQLVQGVSTVLSSELVTLARASFTVDTPEHLSLGIYADNITNESRTQAIAPPQTLDNAGGAFRPRPRMIGVQLEYKF